MSGAFIGMSIDTSIRLDVYRSEGCHHRRNGSPLLLMVFTQRCSTLRVYLTGIPSFSFFGVTSKCNYGQSESKQKTDGRLSRSVAFHLGGTAWYIYRLAFFRVIIALFSVIYSVIDYTRGFLLIINQSRWTICLDGDRFQYVYYE